MPSVIPIYRGENRVGALHSGDSIYDYVIDFENNLHGDAFRLLMSNPEQKHEGGLMHKYLRSCVSETPRPEVIDLDDWKAPLIENPRSVSSTGGEKEIKPERYSLIPKPPLDLLARVYGFGEKKYAPHNFRKGYEYSKSYDALQRHLAAWWAREDNDPESGLSHLGHAAWHVFALICFSSDKRYAQFDDRYKAEES